jgi:hypothetical protein
MTASSVVASQVSVTSEEIDRMRSAGRRPLPIVMLAVLVAIITCISASDAMAASAAPRWDIQAVSLPSVFPSGEYPTLQTNSSFCSLM